MNILFYLLYHPATGMGGIERITGRLCDAFVKYGHHMFCIYGAEYNNVSCDREFAIEKELCVPNIRQSAKEVAQFLRENKIDVVINQSFFCSGVTEELLRNKYFSDVKFDCAYLRQIIDSLPHPCKLVSAYHTNPGSEYLGRTWKKNVLPIITEAKNLSGLIWGIKSIGGAAKVQLNFHRLVGCYYRQMHQCSDRVVLLSDTFKSDWLKSVQSNNAEQVCSIPNMLSYHEWLDETELPLKEKTVLIVSRLDEHQKRISTALRIWKKIEQDLTLQDWRLVIVGDGGSEKMYKDYAASHLSRVSFEGWKEPKEYYKKASVFMMTSAYEGWGLTLTEAQQFGCVPIALHTYKSVVDIISDGENGYLAKSEQQFTAKLSALMKSSELRMQMAKSAIQTSCRFSEDAVCELWLKLLSNI